MRQRAMIAMALSCNPELLIADEPTTALDVTVQAQILALLRKLQRDFGSAIILITHDMGVVAEVADRVCVMYAGRIVEDGAEARVLRERAASLHWGLLDSIPRIDRPQPRRLTAIPGLPPVAAGPAAGLRLRAALPHASRPAPSGRRSRSGPRPGISTAASCPCPRSVPAATRRSDPELAS